MEYYRIEGHFRREFIFGYFKEAFLLENKFLVTAFLQKFIPTAKLTASREDFSVSESVCVMAYLSSRLPDSGKHSKGIYCSTSNIFIGMASTYYQLQMPSQRTWFIVNEINIRSA